MFRKNQLRYVRHLVDKKKIPLDMPIHITSEKNSIYLEQLIKMIGNLDQGLIDRITDKICELDMTNGNLEEYMQRVARSLLTH